MGPGLRRDDLMRDCAITKWPGIFPAIFFFHLKLRAKQSGHLEGQGPDCFVAGASLGTGISATPFV